MRKLLMWFGVILLVLVIVYLVGPRPATPQLNAQLPVLQQNLATLEKTLAESEAKVPNLKPDNQARIVWFDTTQKKKTPYSVVYLHGFSASYREGYPVIADFAMRYGCNAVWNRMPGHGIADEDAYLEITPEKMLESARQAVAIGQAIGDKVIIIATSTGGALAYYLASENPQIHALITYSPLIDFYESALNIMDKPWGLQLSRLVMGGKYQIAPKSSTKVKQYWSTKYRLEGAVALKSLIAAIAKPAIFSKVKQPVFLGYYYKDEAQQDKLVSVKAMQEMFKQLGTAPNLKREKAFPNVRNHVIASELMSKDVAGVRQETFRFAEEILGLKKR
jgi:pimeloyl-ACP methyl ester carboxylesterase